jgi:hypothetical protein
VVDLAAIRRIAASWPGRATVRHDLDRIEAPETYDADVPDYPTRLMPFAEHPGYLALSPAQQRDISTMAWLVYNERVIAAEEHVANPTFAMIVHGVFPGATSYDLKRTVQQAHIDETFHTYMHMVAMQRTREVRRLPAEPTYPTSVTLRRLLTAQAAATERWERDLLALVWTTVAEISVNAYLSLLSRDRTIQPMHALVPQLHARDESAHGSLMVEVAKSVYLALDEEKRRAFRHALPLALHAFMAQDFSAWRVILEAAGVANGDAIVADCEHSMGNGLLVRDFSGIRRLARELAIDDVDLGSEASLDLDEA